MGADIVCIPEFAGTLVVDSQFQSETVAGPAIEAFAALAAKYTMYVIVPLLEKVQGGFRFTQFTIYPKVTVPEQKDEERALRLLEKAEHTCLITRSLSARVVVEATVVAGVAPVGV